MWSDIRIRRLPAIIDIGGSPNGVERSVQSKPGIDFPGELLWCRDNRFQRSANIGIAMSLAAGKSAAMAAKEGEMRLQLLSQLLSLNRLLLGWLHRGMGGLECRLPGRAGEGGR